MKNQKRKITFILVSTFILIGTFKSIAVTEKPELEPKLRYYALGMCIWPGSNCQHY